MHVKSGKANMKQKGVINLKAISKKNPIIFQEKKKVCTKLQLLT